MGQKEDLQVPMRFPVAFPYALANSYNWTMYVCTCRTLNTLQSYLHSLKDDMNKLHRQMDHHSATMKESYKSSR